MHTFIEHIRLNSLAQQLQLLWESHYDIDHDAYDQLFATELRRLASKVRDPATKAELETMASSFKFTRYIASSVRQAGVLDPREKDERTHDVASKLLLGKLFDFDPVTIPFAARFKTSVVNALKNFRSKEQNRRRLLPSTPISNEPGIGISSDELAGREVPDYDEGVVDEFRDLVHSRLGSLGTAVLNLRMGGEETKSLIGSVEHGEPTSYRVKQTVIAIKQLADEFAQKRGDEEFARQVVRAMDSERRTVDKRFGVKT